MPESIPFFRGPFQVDLLDGAMVLSDIYQGALPAAQQVLDVVDPTKDFSEIPGSDVLPRGMLAWSHIYVFVALVGTETYTQQILNIVGSGQAPITGVPGKVGVYWSLAAQQIWDGLKTQLDVLLPGRRLVFFGHSLGGAVCDIMLALARVDYPDTEVAGFTYGAPRPGDPAFAAFVGPYVTRVEDTGDPILALPPPIWAGPGSNWPIPGPPPFDTWVHPGSAVTVAEDGTITPGSDPMNIGEAYVALWQGLIQPHYMNEYSRRLFTQIPPDELEVDTSNFAHPQLIEPILTNQLGGAMASPGVTVGTAATYKVSLFYNYGQAGIGEEWYSTLAPTVLRSTTIPGYLQVRMAMAVPQFQFVYARISNPAKPRWVDFLTSNDNGVTQQGTLGVKNSIKDLPPAGAEDDGALLSRMKLVGGPSARQFLHGFDQTQTDEGTFTPNSAFKKTYAAYTKFLSDAGNGVQFSYGAQAPAKLDITTIVAKPIRGYTVTPKVANPALQVGNVVYIGGTGRSIVGTTGRKIITNVTAGGTAFDVGGASPVGTYNGVGGFYYVVSPTLAVVDYMQVERLTSHRVGRPFAEPVGKKSARLSLRL